MIVTDQPDSVALRIATLHYLDIPAAAWATALLRARQLGANTIVVPLRLERLLLPGGTPDLAGQTSAQHNLPALVQHCAQAGLALILRLDLPATTPHAWLAALAETLAACQAPRGPIVALQLGQSDSRVAGWLRATGWHIPIDPAPADPAELLEANPHLSSRPVAGAPALLRPDASARPAFWRAKSIRMVVGSVAADFAGARAPADLALLAGSPALLALADRLAGDNAAFDLIDAAAATPEQLARYILVVAPAGLTHSPAAAQLLATAANVTLLTQPGDTPAEGFFSKPRLPHDISAERLYETLEALGGKARYAWADAAAVRLRLRASRDHSYIFVHNRRSQAYSGMLAYRAADGAVLHLQASLGAGRAGVVLLHNDEVLGVAIDSDGTDVGWRARGLQTSMAFNNGAGGIVAYNNTLLATAAQSGRFQLRAGQPWPAMVAFRLLLSGAPLPTPVHVDAAHLTLPYLADDDCGQTDCYLALPAEQPLPQPICHYLATLLRARSAVLAAAAKLAQAEALDDPAATLYAAAAGLALADTRITSMNDYAGAWRASEHLVSHALHALLAAGSHPAETIAAMLEAA